MRKKSAQKAGWVPVNIERSDSFPGRVLAR
jgi:hypothetical protein